MSICYLDIETGSASPEILAKLKPEFTAAKNLRDPVKIAEDIAAKEQSWLDNAAKSAETGQVLCIGRLEQNQFMPIHGPENKMLEVFWEWLEITLSGSNQVVGFCIFHFDLSFMARRSWVHGIKVPGAIRRGRYWADGLIDIAEVWQCGNREQTISLDRLAKVLGVGAKAGSGADFAKLWVTDRAEALAYLLRDLELTKACWERMT